MHLTRDGVQCQIAEAERGGIGRFVDRGAAQQRAHPGQQLLQRKGLGQVVVGARIQPGHSLRDRIASGKDQDRQIIPRAAQATTHLKAVELGHHDVEHQCVGAIVGDHVQRVDTILGQIDRVPIEGQGTPQRLAHSTIVVDYKNSHRHQC